jgi:hypothetical protein
MWFKARLVAVGLGLMALSPAALAAELLMFRREGCTWCQAFDRAIGPVYPKTDLARRAPLRHLDLDGDPRPNVELAYPVRYTPTFVLVSNGREVGRIEGYPSEEFFWGLLDNLVRRVPAQS